MRNIFLLLFVTLSTVAFSQKTVERSNNKVKLNGKAYYIHIVGSGETLFSISQAYNVPIDTIKMDNMQTIDNINENQFLKIRVLDEEPKESNYILHKVIKGDTPTNLSLRYKVKIDDIYKYNPNARMGIYIGENLKIPLPIKEPIKTDTATKEKTQTQEFIIHIVEKKQTIFGLAVLYKTSKEEIEKLNPKYKKSQIKEGDFIKIPLTDDNMFSIQSFYFHKVKAKENEYRLALKYKIKERELKKLNPILKNRDLQVDEWIRIARNEVSDSIFAKTKPQLEIKAPPKDSYSIWKSDLIIPKCEKKVDTITSYKVALFLPFYLNMNDYLSKSLYEDSGFDIDKEEKEEEKIYAQSKIFVEFYQGVLLALNDLKLAGMPFEVSIFDTQKDSLHTLKILKENPQLANFDLFIGPMYSNILEVVSNFARDHKINIVSPLSLKHEFISNNPYSFQVSPPFDVQMYYASEFLNSFKTKNYIVIHDGNNMEQEYISLFKKNLYTKMSAEDFNLVKYNEVFYYDAQDSILKSVFSPEIENIVIIPSGNQAFVTDIIGKLNSYSYQFDITTFGQPKWLRFDNIELENFHNTKTHIITNSYIDYYDPDVINFIKQFRLYFNSEPDKYSYQGYDIAKYFLTALNMFGKDFKKCLHTHNIKLLQTKLNFLPYSDKGGYQNTAIYILEFAKDYKLKKVASYPDNN